MPDTDLNGEYSYWTKVLDVGKPLMPISASFSELKEELNKGLRSLLLIHIMCIVLLCTRRFPELEKFNLPTRPLSFFLWQCIF